MTTVYTTIDPATGEPIESYPVMSQSQVMLMIDKMRVAQKKAAALDHEVRLGWLERFCSCLERQEEKAAKLLAKEMGKTYQSALWEVRMAIANTRVEIVHFPTWLAPRVEERKADGSITYSVLKSSGITYAIKAWNFPLAFFLYELRNTTCLGNGLLYKPSENVIGLHIFFEELLREAGYPEDLVRVIVIDHVLSPKIIEHEAVSRVSFTGSTRVGRLVGAQAGGAIKGVSLELGGSDPHVLMEDADPVRVADHLVDFRSHNTGQICISPKRIIVPQPLLRAFTERALVAAKKVHMGHPMDARTTMGPLARKDLREHVHQQVRKSIDRGAHLLLGGTIPDGEGWYYPFTILTGVKPGMPAFDEEIFGPVLAIVPSSGNEESFRLANHTMYGLWSGVYSARQDVATHYAENVIEAGASVVNGAPTLQDALVPFGGFKASGNGARDGGRRGLEFFANIKTIVAGRMDAMSRKD